MWVPTACDSVQSVVRASNIARVVAGGEHGVTGEGEGMTVQLVVGGKDL
jgi:hypothetical protein